MKKFISFISLLVCASVLVACSGKKSADSNQSSIPATGAEKIVKIGWQDSGFLSPFTFTKAGPGGYLRNSFIFDALTWKDETGVIPWLASDWEISEDELIYTFTIVDNANFSNGEALTASDVAFSYDYFKKYGYQWSADMSKIEKTEVIDKTHVKITLTEKFVPFISEIAGILPIIPESIWKDVTDPKHYLKADALIGSGPFVLKKYDEAAGNYQFEKNSNYFKGNVTVAGVQYLAVQDRMLSLTNKEIDGGMTFSHAQKVEMEKQGFTALASEPTGSAVRIVFNLNKKQFASKELRQGIAYALDRAEISKKVLGSDQPMVGSAGVIPPDSDWYNENVKQYAYDTKKAEEIFTSLGYEKVDGHYQELNLKLISSGESKEALIMKDMLAKVGVTLEVQALDAAAFNQALADNDYDMAITGHIGYSGDPDFLRLWFSGQAYNTFAGTAVFENKVYQELATLQMSQSDEKARHETVNKMQDILAEELPTLLLYHRPFYFMYDATVFDGWFNTANGISDGIPLTDNKLAFVDVTK
ncbi:DNA-binding protein [Lactococcus hodotermopsidis]|uniref:DNA-binding protein n=1 Tax=Pseudolactococcus hodotermopsidis TaxID=2709157 RepID=A0A6A0BBS0_9LACT|nr:ABC transporter substrate-binding protein [Lactococcus hodotermopsidis]GFH42123.1 DNA-binding protein [Lactococcus hodotermopsidis]